MEPGRLSAAARPARLKPLVVRAVPGRGRRAVVAARMRSIPLRSNGSPPVNRTLLHTEVASRRSVIRRIISSSVNSGSSPRASRALRAACSTSTAACSGRSWSDPQIRSDSPEGVDERAVGRRRIGRAERRHAEVDDRHAAAPDGSRPLRAGRRARSPCPAAPARPGSA